MKSKPLVASMLLLVVLLAPAAGLRAQDETLDEADLEVLEPVLDPIDPAGDAAQAEPWPVCRNAHWIRSAPGYPPVCTTEHIKALFGPLGPCSIIELESGRYHIRRVQKTDRGWIITVVKPE